MTARESRPRLLARWSMAAIYLVAGIAHLKSPGGFLAITPHWVPFPATVVALTGIAEIAGAIGLMLPSHVLLGARQAAGIGLALYAVCVFPANINHAINGIAIGGDVLGWGYHAPRLLFQPVAVWWALWVGGITDWPFESTCPRQTDKRRVS